MAKALDETQLSLPKALLVDMEQCLYRQKDLILAWLPHMRKNESLLTKSLFEKLEHTSTVVAQVLRHQRGTCIKLSL